MKEDDYMKKNNNNNKKCIAYLDLLGFKNYVTSNKNCAYAANVLISVNIILKTLLIDQNNHPADSYEEESLKKLAERTSVTSFESLLPLSDSIFITSNEANLFIEQLSSFLLSCFRFYASQYVNPEDPEYPEHVNERVFDIQKKEFVDKPSKWYPVLFRGGISSGEVLYDDVISIDKRKKPSAQTTPNIIGKGVVQAVQLEGSGKGPRLFIDNNFYKKLNKKNKKFVRKDTNGNKYFLWPVFQMSEMNSYENAWFELRSLVDASINLWKAYRNKPYGEHYLEFMKLVMDSFVCFCEVEHSNDIDAAKTIIRNYIKEQDVDLALLNLI